MAAAEPLYSLIGVVSEGLSKNESILLEADLFARVCEELKEAFRGQYKDYFSVMKFTIERENVMLETKLARLIIQDILSTGDYNMEGIACYTDTYEDVIQEVMAERNTSPSAAFLRKLISLHRLVRRELYESVIKKITTTYLAVA